MSKRTDLLGRLDAARKELATVFEEAGPDYDFSKVKSIPGDNLDDTAKAEWLRAKNQETADLAKEIKALDELDGMKKRNDELGELQPHPGHGRPGEKGREEPSRKSVIDQIVEHGDFGKKEISYAIPGVNVKTLFQEAGSGIAYTAATAGWGPMDVRLNQFVEYASARQPLRVASLIPKTTTTSNAIMYIQESSFSNAATSVGEGSAKPEAALGTTTVTEPVRKLAVWIPVTDEQLSDVPQVRGYLENRLGFMVNQLLDSQILVGDGVSQNIKGIEARAGLQTAQAKGSDPAPDAVFKAMTKIRVNDFSEPNGVVFHPNDWQDNFRLLRTADGIYIWGNPGSPDPDALWGLDVVQTTAQTENTALVGDFRQAELAMREGLNVKVTDSHASYFISNIQVILVELRAALLVYRPGAFCKVTGL